MWEVVILDKHHESRTAACLQGDGEVGVDHLPGFASIVTYLCVTKGPQKTLAVNIPLKKKKRKEKERIHENVTQCYCVGP